MSRIPQSTHTTQPEQATIATSDSHTSPSMGGALFDTSEKSAPPKVRAKARVKASPELTAEQVRELYQQTISDLEGKIKKKDFYIESQAGWVEQYKQSDASLRNQLEKAKQELASAVKIAEETLEDQRVLINENGELRARVAELEEMQGNQADQASAKKISDLEALLARKQEYISWQDTLITEYQDRERWQKKLRHTPELEAATKLVIMDLKERTIGKEDTYTQIYTEDVARSTGMKRQAAGRHIGHAIEWGMFGATYTEEAATVPDKRLGTRDITKKITNIIPNSLLARPEDFRRGDGKQHGGSLPRCKRCGAENTLKRIYHTVCLGCGHEDILMPEEAQAAIDRAKQDEQAVESEPAALVVVATPAQVVEMPALVTEVQDEHQSETALQAEERIEDRRIMRIDAWGAARGYPRAQMTNGTIIPEGPIAWKGFCKYRNDLHQQAYEDICNGLLRKTEVVR